MGKALLFFLTFFSFVVHALDDVPVHIEALSAQELVGNTRARERRVWTREDETTLLYTSFETWRTCHEKRVNRETMPDSCFCEQGTSGTLDLASNFIGIPSCVPDRSDRSIAYNEDLTEPQKRERDDIICGCIDAGRSFESIGGIPPSKRDVQQIGLAIQSRIHEAGFSQRQEQEFQLKYSTAINAINFADSSGRAERLGGVYIAEDRRISRGRNKSEKNFNLEKNIQSLLDRNNVTGNQCIPYSDFLLHVQFSEDPSLFYNGGAFNGEFKEEDWDYRKLLEKLGNSYQTYDSVSGSSYENQLVLSKMRFLHNNPSFKNLFASNDVNSRGKKRDLFNLLKNHYPRPSCSDASCNRGEEWARQVAPFRQKISQFLSDDEINDDIQTGIERISELSVAAQEAHISFQAESPFSENLGADPLVASSDSWRAFCQFRANPERNRKSVPSANLALLVSIEDAFGRNFMNPMADDHFKRVNAAYCERPRRSRSNTQMSFNDFKRSCGTQEHRACLTSYIREYPYPTPTAPGALPEMDTFLNEIYLEAGVLSPDFERDQISRVVAIGKSPELRRSSFQELSSGNYPASGSVRPASIAGAVAPTPTAAATAQRNAPQSVSAQNTQTLENFTPSVVTQPTVATDASSVTTPGPVTREQVRQATSEADELRAEIANLRQTIASQRSSSPGTDNDTMLRELNARALALESSLAEKNSEIDEMRQRRASSDDDAEDSVTRRKTSARNPRRSVASVDPQLPMVQAAGSVTSQVSQSSQGISSGGNTGGVASLSSGSVNSASRTPGSRAALNNELLSINDKRDGISGNAITVDQASGVVAGNGNREGLSSAVIPLTVSPEDFNELRNSNGSILGRYMDQLQGAPSGEFTINLRDQENRMLEVLVKKEGDTLTIVRSPVERAALLENLNFELQNK